MDSGIFIRLRYKFDEDIFKSAKDKPPAIFAAAQPQSESAASDMPVTRVARFMVAAPDASEPEMAPLKLSRVLATNMNHADGRRHRGRHRRVPDPRA